MDSLLKAFSISFLLRSIFSGIFFVISYRVASQDPLKITTIDGTTMFPIVLPVALFAGVIGYGIHRSLIHPWLEWFFDSKTGMKCRDKIPLISKNTVRTLLWRWNLSAEGLPADQTIINTHISVWGDFIHLQYVSMLCIALGALVGVFTALPNTHQPYWPLINLAIVLFIAGFVSNWRHYRVIDCARDPSKLLETES
ncbi:MAG: hypothetical protein WCV00_05085 [Verrucomicrobiia bacterium]|jgi:hypothetical protein